MTGTVFFDLDGTLTDSKPGIVSSLRYALERMDCELRVDDDLDWCIGPPLSATFERLVGSSGRSRRLIIIASALEPSVGGRTRRIRG